MRVIGLVRSSREELVIAHAFRAKMFPLLASKDVGKQGLALAVLQGEEVAWQSDVRYESNIEAMQHAKNSTVTAVIEQCCPGTRCLWGKVVSRLHKAVVDSGSRQIHDLVPWPRLTALPVTK